MDCQETQAHVHEYLHNHLSEQEIQEITAHLANCDHCEAHYDFENLINNVIKEACDEAPPQDLVNRIMEQIRSLNPGEKH